MFFIGHSHVVSLEQAADRSGVPYRSLNLWGFGRPVIYGDGPPRLDPFVEGILHDQVVSVVGGSAHDMIGLAQHPRPFDFVLPEAPDLPLDRRAEVLPAAAVARRIESQMEEEQLDLVRLLTTGGRTVVHLEPPPPIGDDPRLAREMFHAAFVPRDASGPSSPWLRHKLWRLHSLVVRRACEAAGVEFLPAPPESMVDGLFLRPELYDRPCHANAQYGAMVLRQLGLLA